MIVVHLSEKSTAAEETPVAAVETAATPAAPAAETK